MEAGGLALGVVAAFKDVYLTAKFIKKTVQSIKGYQAEQSQLVMHYTVQIYRLKNLSRLFRAADGNTVDMKLLETVPNEYLNTVRDVLSQLQQVLAKYSKLAASLDEDYQRFSPLSPHFKFDPVNDTFEIDDTGAQDDETNSPKSPEAKVAGPKWWPFRSLAPGSHKAFKASTKLVSLKSLPMSMQWVFQKGDLEETLQAFETWNKDLEYLIAPLLVGFGFYDENRNLQGRLLADGDGNVKINIFQGHVDLNNLTTDDSGGKQDDASGENDNFISYKDAEAKAEDTRILAEFKSIITIPEQGNTSNTKMADITRPMKELYGPQLARLLRTAGEYPFRTPPLNSYAWDVEKAQYIFLFDYPPNTSSRKPKSLNDLILSSEPRYKLELKQRFVVAQTMARAIGAFHSDGWLHKSIRSHAVKFFYKPDGHTCDFAEPYLTNFELSRPLGGVTRLVPQAMDLDHEVYRHPDRHGLPGTSFSKIHDIYSLGVVLLEIGLWQTARQIYNDVVEYELGGSAPSGVLPPNQIKQAYLQDARERLAHRMGTAYQEAVVACLDGDWEDFIGSREFAKEFQKQVVQKVDIKAFIG